MNLAICVRQREYFSIFSNIKTILIIPIAFTFLKSTSIELEDMEDNPE